MSVLDRSARGAAPSPWVASTPKRLGSLAEHGSLKSVGSALDVLELFATDAELGVSDIARRLGVAKSTAHRLLQTLASRGFIEQDHETGQYRLGLHLFELGQLALGRHELRHAALPTLRQIAAATHFTVNLGVADGPDVVFVERIEATNGTRFLGHVGRRLPAHTTSSGKVLAAFSPEVYAARLAAGFPPRVGRSVRTAEDWERTIAQVRHDRYAVSNSESFDGASSVAVPILVRKVCVATLSIFGPTDELAPRIDKLLPLLIAGSHRIARAVAG